MQIEEHEIKTLKFLDISTIFLRDTTFLNRIQGILKPYKNTKIIFSKRQVFMG